LKKPGYKTSEFWLTLATIAGTAVASIAGGLPGTEGAALTGGLATAYGIFRVAVKIAQAFADASGASKQ
jgi:hypothetical protein